MAGSTITIGEDECAVILAAEGDRLVVRIATSDEPEGDSEEIELPIPKILGLAIATRLTEDPDFADEMLDWFDDYSEENPDG